MGQLSWIDVIRLVCRVVACVAKDLLLPLGLWALPLNGTEVKGRTASSARAVALSLSRAGLVQVRKDIWTGLADGPLLGTMQCGLGRNSYVGMTLPVWTRVFDAERKIYTPFFFFFFFPFFLWAFWMVLCFSDVDEPEMLAETKRLWVSGWGAGRQPTGS
ncbi:hypothetical protein IWX49DRAFT_187136 [Phyllosticta citricarpa]